MPTSVTSLSHRKPLIHEDLRPHVLDSSLVAGVSSAIGQECPRPAGASPRRMRLGVIAWGGESGDSVLGPMTSLQLLRQEHGVVRAPLAPCLSQL